MKSYVHNLIPDRMFLLLTLLVPLAGLAHGKVAEATWIPVGLAQHVASEHVHANNQPYQWHALDHIVLYDIDGNPNAYAFVFAKADSRFKVEADLRRHVEAGAIDVATNHLGQTQPFVIPDDEIFGLIAI